MTNTLRLSLAGGFLAFCQMASAVLITDVGINITNDGVNLVADVPQAVLGNQNPGTQFAWLSGLIPDYNTITSSNLPLPGLGTPFIQDDDSSENGTYVLTNGLPFYVVAHYGQSNTAWFIESANGALTYGMPGQASDFGGEGKGLSNVRIWQASRTVSVPDGGTTLALFGVSLLGLGCVRRKLA